MRNRLMAGVWRYILGVPPFLWERQIEKARRKVIRSTRFMTQEHRSVHHFVVRELPRVGGPISPETVAKELGLSLERTRGILEELEKHLTFLYRNGNGEVTWAYPVTVEKTPHAVAFDSGEQLYAAWAVDAFATPFVQGRLRKQETVIRVASECAHCKRPMHMEIDSEMNCRSLEESCSPLVFVPDVNFGALEDPSIIDAFWKESVFFWSEEHAREHRRREHRIRGAYFTKEQIAYLNRKIQSVMFGG